MSTTQALVENKPLIIRLPKGNELDVKRFRIDDNLQFTCKECHTDHTHNFAEHYLSYPQVGDKYHVWWECPKCKTNNDLPLRIAAITVEFEHYESIRDIPPEIQQGQTS